MSPLGRRVLHSELTGGVLLLVAAVAALAWANSPAGAVYRSVRDHAVGPLFLRLHLTVADWSAQGLLAVFFLVAGIELKRELLTGELRDRRRAIVPVAAAVAGMAVPAVVYTLVNAASGGDLSGWAVPTATDIAFALSVLAVLGRRVPPAVRTFLLTLAVVDDLLAITIIAVFYADALRPGWLALALVSTAGFGLVARRTTSPWLLGPLGVLTWALVHASGVHATVAGVLLGFALPAGRAARSVERVAGPLSALVAVPVFALFAAGVDVGGWTGLGDAARDPVALGAASGLVVGKTVGIAGSTWLLVRFTRARLHPSLTPGYVLGTAVLAGVGFTVSLLIAGLAFGAGAARSGHAEVGVLAGSVIAAAVGATLLATRSRRSIPCAVGDPPIVKS